MPFRSEKQRRFMWMHHPEVAKKWVHKYGSTPVGKVAEARMKRRKNARS